MHILPLSFGIVLLAISLFLLLKEISFSLRAHKTKGVIINLIKKKHIENSDPDLHTGGSDTLYYPTVQFSDFSGKTIEFVCWGASSTEGFYEGKSVEVIYDKKKPNKALINQWSRRWMPLLICAFFGLLFSFFGWSEI